MKLKKLLKGAVSLLSPITGLAMHGADKAKRASKEAAAQYERQLGAIRQQSQAAELERGKIAAAREKSEARVRAGQMRSNRKRVRGGLFGDTSVDQNVSPRLG